MLLLLLGRVLCLSAQFTQVPYGLAFPQDEVPSIRMTIHPDTLAALLETGVQGSDREYKATFRFESSGLTQTIQQVGFRLRGNTSLQASKKSFKVSFNTFVRGGDWQGLEKLNLNGSHNDPSMIRAKLAWDLMRDCGLTAARTGFVKLYINDEYRGLYTNVEHIDEEFCQKHIDDKGNGDLFKCLYPATLEYLGSNPNWYKVVAGSRRIYELTNNQYLDDYTQFARFVTILNETPLESLPCSLETVFNVHRYLKQAAIDVLLANWDGYAFNKNNFYLYQNKKTGLFEYIPYDVDNTFGIDWFGVNWATRNPYTWSNNQEPRPLFQRLLSVPEYRAAFTHYMHGFLQSGFTFSNISSKVLSYLELIEEAALADPYRSLDYGFSGDDFQNSGNEAWGAHVPWGILPYCAARIDEALAQLDDNPGAPQAWMGFQVVHNFPYHSEAKLIAWGLPGNEPIEWVWNQGGSWASGNVLRDDGQFPDEVASDGRFTASIDGSTFNEAESVLIGLASSPGSEPFCSPRRIFLQESELPIYINELMSDNSGIVLDDFGRPSDWIELYNGSSVPFSLGGKFLSDDPEDPTKWPLPINSIPVNGFELFWADGRPELNRYHTSFSLNADGEDLRLYQQNQGGYQLLDRIVFPAVPENLSYGRLSDGASFWVEFNTPTPDASNQYLGFESPDKLSWKVFPNPSNGHIEWSAPVQWLKIMDAAGKVVLQKGPSKYCDASHLSAGLYYVLSDRGGAKWIKE